MGVLGLFNSFSYEVFTMLLLGSRHAFSCHNSPLNRPILKDINTFLAKVQIDLRHVSGSSNCLGRFTRILVQVVFKLLYVLEIDPPPVPRDTDFEVFG